ncbi:MAG: helix-turn-helix domain-containing protein [Actinomycetia bacterium]|nr:helix-turn-helix domain-containing protein [Actinomycetes bacterium]
MSEENKFYTIKEATGMLGISEKELIRYIEEKKVPVLKVGRALRLSEENIDNFLSDSKDYKDDGNNGFLEDDLKEVFPEGFPEDTKEETADKEYQTFKNIQEPDLKTKQLQEECGLLIEKKQELEEDINYLQVEYDEFRNKMKKLVVEELKAFLKKIDDRKIELEEKSFKE